MLHSEMKAPSLVAAVAATLAWLSSIPGAEARLSNWRAEFVKCSYLNYELNASRAVQFCGQTPRFFCCHFENTEVINKCCTLDQLLDELRLQFIAAKLLSWLVLSLLAVLFLSCLYILIKSKRLLKTFFQK